MIKRAESILFRGRSSTDAADKVSEDAQANQNSDKLDSAVVQESDVQVVVASSPPKASQLHLIENGKSTDRTAGNDTDALRDIEEVDADGVPVAYRPFRKLHPLCYAGLAGTFGAQTCLFAKSTAEIIKTSIQGDNQMTEPLTYVILLAMGTTIFLEQHWLASGLQYFDALYIVPVFQAFFIGVSVIGGATYFNELANFTTLQWLFFPFGVLLCLAGVLLLSDRQMGSLKEEVAGAEDDGEKKDAQGDDLLREAPLDGGSAGDATGGRLQIELSTLKPHVDASTSPRSAGQGTNHRYTKGGHH